MKKIFLKLKTLWINSKTWFLNSKYHEEMIAIPIIIFIFYLCNYIFTAMFPNSAFFDFASQIETFLNNIVMFIIAITVANISISIIFPNIYKYLRNEFYNFNIEQKSTYAVAILIAFIIAAALIFG